MKRIACLTMAVLLLSLSGCAEKEDAVVYPEIDEKTTLIEGDNRHKLSFYDMAQEASVIVCADVTEAITVPVESGWKIACSARVEIKEVLKGGLPIGESICVEENGVAYAYLVDENRQPYPSETNDITRRATLCGGPMMVKGNRVLLFLTGEGDNLGSEENPYYITPGSSGKFYLDRDGKYHNSMLYYKEYDENIHKFYSQLADIEPKTLDEIKTLING